MYQKDMLETTVWSLTCVILLKQRDGRNGLLVDSRKPDEVTLKYSCPLLQKMPGQVNQFLMETDSGYCQLELKSRDWANQFLLQDLASGHLKQCSYVIKNSNGL